ncbi:2-carboxy-1,4-naphthoquinone phytyltransferase [Candidatus Atelocyanobacterium thalassae]|uniref:2-carboxy-1,4-naphthoquinone phytyltransferase n=2 Tax=Candidatus Atelocyanobacterium thalassae TaxID=713887 RepID=A0A086CIW9_9CHRO|nr:2-carboxy-1,4-naphthoquinone phytyltransferase [Candidatus Atelocyanobacterium thalassa]KFF42133.1 MAG: 1,4-dihydroxy-2-naphthoate phytyltransferase [Candidatus Atelocyanobacterium thalassa isolate SIO64986]BDA39943.1 1,4-dihydroxy-2-naphthoate phytyltransferase [cyanobacterium endosymbiont of Braarudosphaera bigelowii]
MSIVSTKKLTSKQKLWLAAIKIPVYSVSIIPIIVGSSAAFENISTFNFRIFTTFLISSILIIAWINVSNDIFDADTGIDKNKAHSIVNLTKNKSLIFWLSNIFLILGIVGIILISWWQKDLTVLCIVTVCCILGYSYQGPPFRLGYKGLGEIICFITFGPMAVSASYYSQVQHFSIISLASGILIGISTSIILFCSHFHQIEDDFSAGKRSPIVFLGTELGSIVLTIITVLLMFLVLLFPILKILSFWTFLSLLSFPIAYQLVCHVLKYHNQASNVKNSKFIAIKFHFFNGILLSVSLILSKLV